jgi:hypothetical protein
VKWNRIPNSCPSSPLSIVHLYAAAIFSFVGQRYTKLIQALQAAGGQYSVIVHGPN